MTNSLVIQSLLLNVFNEQQQLKKYNIDSLNTSQELINDTTKLNNEVGELDKKIDNEVETLDKK